jgi:hypothetical protein
MQITREEHLAALDNPREILTEMGITVQEFGRRLKKVLRSEDENVLIKALNLQADVLALKVRTQQITGMNGKDLFTQSEDELRKELKRLRVKNDQG